MALAIDTKDLIECYVPEQENYFDYLMGARRQRLALHRVCVYASVFHDVPTLKECIFRYGSGDNAAMNWQAEQDDEQDELEVFHHLKQLAAKSSLSKFSNKDGRLSYQGAAGTITTLVASVQSPSFSAHAQGRLPSSFYRFSVRMNMADQPGILSSFGHQTDLKDVIPNCSTNGMWGIVPKIVLANTTESYGLPVIWQIQLDFVDLDTPLPLSSRSSGKRRRTINPFHQVSSRPMEDTSRGTHFSDAKRFKGVRYRRDRNRWIAEMKPPKSKNKVSFGEFQSQTEAARVVDVAFHHYGKPPNFADTRQLLSKQRTAAGLNADEKLMLVKEQAKWLASIASTLPSTSASSPFISADDAEASVPVEITAESSRGCSADNFRFRLFSEISSSLNCGGADEADDGISHPQPWLHFDAVAGFVGPDFAALDHMGALDEFEEGHNMFQCNVEKAISDTIDIAIFQRAEPPVVMPPSSPARWPGSSVHIVEDSSATLTELVNFSGVEQPFDHTQSMCMNFLIVSPPAPSFQGWSPRDFQGDLADVCYPFMEKGV